MKSGGLKFTILCFCFVFLNSCSKEKVKPEDLIEKSKMIEILADVHLGEISVITFGVDEQDSIAKMYYEHIYRIHEIEEEAYYHSIEYYNGIPKDWAEIYKNVLKLLEERKNQKKETNQDARKEG